jgi:hypothetical protein
MENGPFTDDFPNKPSIYNGFSIAMSNHMAYIYIDIDAHILSNKGQGGSTPHFRN